MKRFVCAVRDSAADAYMAPFCVPNTALAVRSFSDEINRREPGNPMAQHPEDYELWQIGLYTEDTGLLENMENVLLIRGKDCVKSIE